MSDVLLKVSNIETFYGPIQAIRGVSLEVKQGSIVTVLGANGAGKTTILRTISGVLDAERGDVTFEGRSIAGLTPDKVMRAGICHSPEGREIFPFLSVAENLMMGSFTRSDRDGIHADLEMCYGYFPRLKERATQRAGQLSGGEQQMLAMDRAMRSSPKLLLVDELSLGLAPLIVEQLLGVLRTIATETGTGILVVEQHVQLVLDIADRAALMRQGRIIHDGPAAELKHRPELLESGYLGEE